MGNLDDMTQRVMVARGLENTANNRRRAKRALLRSQGYSTGYREELFQDQTEKRGMKLAEMATRVTGTSPHSPNDQRAMKLMSSMGIHAKNQGFSEEAAVSALGGEMGGAKKVRDTRLSIAAAAKARRANRLPPLTP